MTSIYLPSCGAWNIYHFLIYILSATMNLYDEPKNIYIDMTNTYFESNHNFVIELLHIKYPNANIVNCASSPPPGTILLQQLPYMENLNDMNTIEDRFIVYKFIYNTFIDSVKKKSDDVKNRYSKKIYISRKDSVKRNIVNELELVEYLTPLGFQSITLTNISLMEQFAIFYNADVIIGVCGAALTNIIFAKNQTIIIEISSSRLLLEKHFEEISSCFKLNYSRYLNTTIIANKDAMSNDLFINDIKSILI